MESCLAVVHIASEIFGPEPMERSEERARQSYAQLEFDIARETGKQVYVFVCTEGFSYDRHEPEDSERRALQQSNRERLQGGDHLFEAIASREELDKRIHALELQIEHLGRELFRSRKWLKRGLVATIVLVGLLGGCLWWLSHRVTDSKDRVTAFEAELERQRHYIQAVAEVYSVQQAQLAHLRLSPTQLYDHALQSVAQRENISPIDLRTIIDLFIVSVTSDPAAKMMDRALAAFAQQNFGLAAEAAGRSADEARTRRLAAEKLVSHGQAEAKAARIAERKARSLQGDALFANGQYGDAVLASSAALELTSRAEEPTVWASLQSSLGSTLNEFASISLGPKIAEHRNAAIDAHRAALEIRTRAAMPEDWAETHTNLAMALTTQAREVEGAQRARLLKEAIFGYQSALRVYSREETPTSWAWAKMNLAGARNLQAKAAEGSEKLQVVREAVDLSREALAVVSRDALPEWWAAAQTSLGVSLWYQSGVAERAIWQLS
jgi:hypothetical protein